MRNHQLPADIPLDKGPEPVEPLPACYANLRPSGGTDEVITVCMDFVGMNFQLCMSSVCICMGFCSVCVCLCLCV